MYGEVFSRIQDYWPRRKALGGRGSEQSTALPRSANEDANEVAASKLKHSCGQKQF